MRPEVFTLLRETSAEGGTTIRVTGSCMEPRICAGESIRLEKRRIYLPGDIVIFRTGKGDLAAHRVLGARWFRGAPALVTAGDHCIIHDAPVRLDSIAGAAAGPVSLDDRLRALAKFFRIVWRAVKR